MSVARLIGIVLIVLGALTLIYRGFTYTEKEEIVDIGPLEATAETEERVNVPVWVGITLLAGGALLLGLGRVERRAT